MHSPILYAVPDIKTLRTFVAEDGHTIKNITNLCDYTVMDWIAPEADYWDTNHMHDAAKETIESLANNFDIEWHKGYAHLVQKSDAMQNWVEHLINAMTDVIPAMRQLNTTDMYDIILHRGIPNDQKGAAMQLVDWMNPFMGTRIVMFSDNSIRTVLNEGQTIVNNKYKDFYILTDIVGDYHVSTTSV